MPNTRLLWIVRLLCLIYLSWGSTVAALTLGSPQLLSKPDQSLKVEIPIRLASHEQGDLSTLQVSIPNAASYERLGVSNRVLGFNTQAMVYRNSANQLAILFETIKPIPQSEDPFLDVLLTLKWATGSITKTYTLLIGDVQQLVVKPGQTLSGIALQMAPQLDVASLDQAMLALFKANPDAFASGSINRLIAGATLNKPSEALIRSISPAEANQFVADSYAQWNIEQGNKGAPEAITANPKADPTPAKDRLKIGSNIDGSSDERRYTEELVAQEKALEQTKAKLVELEKNIADLQVLLNKSKGEGANKSQSDQSTVFGSYTPALLALALLLFAGIVLWLLAKNARRSEEQGPIRAASHPKSTNAPPVHDTMPDRTKALLVGIDLELPAAKLSIQESVNPITDTLRVKLNLARAYITIEDFSAAKKSLDEIILLAKITDPAITAEARSLLAEIALRKN